MRTSEEEKAKDKKGITEATGRRGMGQTSLKLEWGMRLPLPVRVGGGN